MKGITMDDIDCLMGALIILNFLGAENGMLIEIN